MRLSPNLPPVPDNCMTLSHVLLCTVVLFSGNDRSRTHFPGEGAEPPDGIWDRQCSDVIMSEDVSKNIKEHPGQLPKVHRVGGKYKQRVKNDTRHI